MPEGRRRQSLHPPNRRLTRAAVFHSRRDAVETFFTLGQPRRRWNPDAIQSLAPAVDSVVAPQRVDDVVLPDLENSLRLRVQLDN